MRTLHLPSHASPFERGLFHGEICRDEIAEIAAIVDAIDAGDEAGAEQAARLHVRRACAAALELLDAEPAPPLSEFSTARRTAAGPIPPAP